MEYCCAWLGVLLFIFRHEICKCKVMPLLCNDLSSSLDISQPISSCVCYHLCISICSWIFVSIDLEVCFASVTVRICWSWRYKSWMLMALSLISMFMTAVLFYLMRPFGKRRISNLFVLLGLTVGGANLIFYYQVELAARLYCPKEVWW